jgi:hypothetical protein
MATKDILSTLTLKEKKELVKQIESIEKDLEHKNTVNIRVRPDMIKTLCELAGVHDIKGGAYRGDTIYIGNTDDLFNPELLQHESTHVAQQSEFAKNKIVWFIKRFIKTSKDMGTYKETHGDSEYIKYESSTLTPMELEAYTNQAKKWYLTKREDFAQDAYRTPEGEQKAFRTIGKRNDKRAMKILQEKHPLGKNVQHDIDKLNQIMSETADKDRTMRVFNAVDNVNEITDIIEIIERKLRLIHNNPELPSIQEKFTDKRTKEKFTELYRDKYEEFTKFKKEHEWETAKYNIISFLEDDYTDESVLKQFVEKLEKQLKVYRREPTRFRLDSKKSKDDNIQIQIPPK